MLLLAELAFFAGVILIAPYVIYYGYIRRHLRLPQPHFPMRRRDVKVSVIICTLNAAGVIERKLQNILHQSYPLQYIDVIVIDGGSDDGTVEVVRRLRRQLSPELGVVILQGRAFRGKASQINGGLRTARGEIVVTTDADVEIHQTAIENLVDALSSDNVGAVCAREILTNLNQSMVTEAEAKYRRFYEVLRIGESSLHSTPIFHGGLSGYRREAVSPIDEDVNADDTQLALSVIRNGFRAVYDPSIVFYTKSSHRLREGWTQKVRRGQGLQRVFWRNRDMISSGKFGVFSFPIFAAELYMHLVSPILFVVFSLCFFAFVAPTLLSFVAIVIPFSVGAGILLFMKRRWAPIVFVASFTFYQTALLLAMTLHMLGYNYVRWTKKPSIQLKSVG